VANVRALLIAVVVDDDGAAVVHGNFPGHDLRGVAVLEVEYSKVPLTNTLFGGVFEGDATKEVDDLPAPVEHRLTDWRGHICPLHFAENRCAS
jgi:hypothetical protein